jgi:hypothetical protein
MRPLGTIARLQIQRSTLKVGPTLALRRYHPEPILSIAEAGVAGAGVTARDEEGRSLLDVHHREHPETKQSQRGVNAVSVGFTSHYDAMRSRFGDHMTDGIAGENILLHADALVSESDLAGGLVITTADGRELLLENLIIAEPCVEFTRYALRYPPDARADAPFNDALAFLRDGMRGFYATYRGEPLTVRLGDRAYLGLDPHLGAVGRPAGRRGH